MGNKQTNKIEDNQQAHKDKNRMNNEKISIWMATLITVKTFMQNYELVHNSNINPTTSWFLTHRPNSTSEEPLTGTLEILHYTKNCITYETLVVAGGVHVINIADYMIWSCQHLRKGEFI